MQLDRPPQRHTLHEVPYEMTTSTLDGWTLVTANEVEKLTASDMSPGPGS